MMNIIFRKHRAYEFKVVSFILASGFPKNDLGSAGVVREGRLVEGGKLSVTMLNVPPAVVH